MKGKYTIPNPVISLKVSIQPLSVSHQLEGKETLITQEEEFKARQEKDD
ncbi:hypothetical protein VV11_021450 [Trichodesmium erythraeum 21-75]|nr:hypothetical protein [Trichodesmium erythraeum 21-75]